MQKGRTSLKKHLQGISNAKGGAYLESKMPIPLKPNEPKYELCACVCCWCWGGGGWGGG